MARLFSQRHYVAVAEMLAGMDDERTRRIAGEELVSLFRGDSGKFQTERFRQAADIADLNKTLVLARYEDAECVPDSENEGFNVVAWTGDEEEVIGWALSRPDAWADAAVYVKQVAKSEV